MSLEYKVKMDSNNMWVLLCNGKPVIDGLDRETAIAMGRNLQRAAIQEEADAREVSHLPR